MASIQERLQRKREPLDKWSTREQLSLAFAVTRSGDQNWMSVSRSLKPFGEQNRPSDWFHQKNCAAQYGALLENVETPKRKKRTSGVEAGIETPSENILRKLIAERMVELKKLMSEEKAEYLKLQQEMALYKSGTVTEEQLDLMCKQIEEEEQQKEKETLLHSQWLKERELRKQEIERSWRPPQKINPPLPPIVGHKRKASDSLDNLMDIDNAEGRITPTQNTEPARPALSPLLTSLLKSPSHAQNVVTSSILHSAITSQRPINSTTNPTIASLLSSSATVQDSPAIQQLVSTAISQEPANANIIKDPISDLLDSSDNLKDIEDIENTILSNDDPLPEMKNEEVDNIISDLIDNADIVTDPEQHLLDGNNDIITDFENELEELVNKEKAATDAAEAAAAAHLSNKIIDKSKDTLQVDPFEFQEDPEEFGPAKLNTNLTKPPVSIQSNTVEDTVENLVDLTKVKTEEEINEPIIDQPKGNETIPGSVEIVEVVVMEDEDMEKDLNKSQIQNIVHSSKADPGIMDVKEEPNDEESMDMKDSEDSKQDKEETISEVTSESTDMDIKQESTDDTKDTQTDETDEPSSRRNTFTPEYSGDIFDDMNIEVTKMDKVGKVKRDYSRTKKKEDADFDILLAVENAVSANLEEESESMSEKEDDKKTDANKTKIKIENERSNSPWTEEDDVMTRSRRRYSTPATPIDSIPNSPASSSTYFEDDKEYKSWKKAILLVYSRLATHKYASLFHKPITNDHAPGYHNVIKKPIDLQTIRKNIDNGALRTTAEFQRDVLLMFNNAIMYNKTNDTVYKMATEMQLEGVEQIRILLQAQADTPARRETRTSEAPGNKRKRAADDVASTSKNKKRKED